MNALQHTVITVFIKPASVPDKILYILFFFKIMKRCCTILFVCFVCIAAAASPTNGRKQKRGNAEVVHRTIKLVTDVIVHDIYSPPVASRIYAYVTIAGYEAAIYGNPDYVSFAGQLNGLNPVLTRVAFKEYDASLAAVYAMLTVSKALVISEDRIEAFHKKILQEFKISGMSEAVFNNSVLFGKRVADHILLWASKDNYRQTRSLEKYSVEDDEQTWKPTPPAYMRAVEPNWNKIRPFILDSSQQFKPLPPTPFSKNNSSQFFKEATAVYSAGLKLTTEQKEMANFWDCNPFKINIKGHVMYASKKISPGGHWINITRLACRKANAGFVQAAEAYAFVSIALADGFISCWDEKYRSNVIRPETYINQYIDKTWVPLLQTPPFPEYTSGHSVISAAAAAVLTKLFGGNFSFADSTQTEFGLPVRAFKSFRQASEEAAISRFYGGIHYMPSINNGMLEGKQIGSFITGKLRTRKSGPAVAVTKK